MSLTWRDGLASVLVGGGVALYLLWLAGVEVPGISGVEAMAVSVLVLGMLASAVAVVAGVGAGLLRAHWLYLAGTSVIGVLALVTGIVAIVGGGETALAILVIATGALWAMSTVRHSMLERGGRRTGEAPASEGSLRPAL